MAQLTLEQYVQSIKDNPIYIDVGGAEYVDLGPESVLRRATEMHIRLMQINVTEQFGEVFTDKQIYFRVRGEISKKAIMEGYLDQLIKYGKPKSAIAQAEAMVIELGKEVANTVKPDYDEVFKEKGEESKLNPPAPEKSVIRQELEAAIALQTAPNGVKLENIHGFTISEDGKFAIAAAVDSSGETSIIKRYIWNKTQAGIITFKEFSE